MLVSRVPTPLFPSISGLPKSARLALELIQMKVEAYKYDNSQEGRISIFLPCTSGERVLIVADLTRYRAKLDSLRGVSGFTICTLEAMFQRGINDLIRSLTVAQGSLAEQLGSPVVPKVAKNKAIGLMQQITSGHLILRDLVKLTEDAHHDWLEIYCTDAAMGAAVRLSAKASLTISSVGGAASITEAAVYEEEDSLPLTRMGAAVGGGSRPAVILPEGPIEAVAVCAVDSASALARRDVAVGPCTLLPHEATIAGSTIKIPLGDQSPDSSINEAETLSLTARSLGEATDRSTSAGGFQSESAGSEGEDI